MRRRLRNFIPIVLMALAVQILAPIGACWAASIAASDPLHNAPDLLGWCCLDVGPDRPDGPASRP